MMRRAAKIPVREIETLFELLIGRHLDLARALEHRVQGWAVGKFTRSRRTRWRVKRKFAFALGTNAAHRTPSASSLANTVS